MSSRPVRFETPDEIRAAIEQLKAEHAELEARLGEFEGRVWLSSAEQVERKQVQKLKLQNKDRIQELTRMLQA